MSITPFNGTSLTGTDILAVDFQTLKTAITAEVNRRNTLANPPIPFLAPGGVYTVPAGVTQITFSKIVAPGGSGGTGHLVANVNTGELGGGGGGGAWIQDVLLAVSPGDQFSISVGAVAAQSNYSTGYISPQNPTTVIKTLGAGVVNLSVQGGAGGTFCQLSGDGTPCAPAGFGSGGGVFSTVGMDGGTAHSGGNASGPSGGPSYNGVYGTYGGFANNPGSGGPGGCGYAYAGSFCVAGYSAGGYGLVEILIQQLYSQIYANGVPNIVAGNPIAHGTQPSFLYSYNTYMAILNALNTKQTPSIFATIPQPSVPTITGDTTTTSSSVVNVDTTDLQPGMRIIGTDIPAYTLIKSINGPTSLTMTANATIGHLGLALTIPRALAGQRDPGTNTSNLFVAMNALTAQVLP